MRYAIQVQLISALALVLLSNIATVSTADQTRYLPPKGSSGTTRNITLIAQSVSAAGYFDLAFNGTIPGPTIIVSEGDEVFLTLVNRLSEPVSIHVHGVHYEIKSDGTFHTASYAPPRGSYTYHWVAGPGTAGTWHYHDHVVGNKDVGSAERGLFGALIVRPRDEEPPKSEAVIFMVNKGLFGSIIREGRELALGSTPTLEVDFAERLRLHLVSEGTFFHIFSIEGHKWMDPGGKVVDSKLMGAAETYPFDLLAGWSLGLGDWTYSSRVLDPSNTPHEALRGILRVRPSLPKNLLAIAKITGIELPKTELKSNERFAIGVHVEYSLPAPTTVRVDVVDQETNVILSSRNGTLSGRGVASFQLELVTPNIEKLWRLKTEVKYLVGGSWRGEPEGSAQDTVVKVSGPAGREEGVLGKPEQRPQVSLISEPILLAALAGFAGLVITILILRRRSGGAGIILALVILIIATYGQWSTHTPEDRRVAEAAASEGRSITLVAEVTQLRPLSWAFNGSVPGPTMIVNPRDRVSLTIVNRLREDLQFEVLRALAEDGLKVEVNVSQSIPPGSASMVSWSIGKDMVGTWYYRDRNNADRGLFGAIIVREHEAVPDREFIIFMVGFEMHSNMLHKGGELALGVNPTLEARLGEVIRFHVITEGKLLHTFHIHAHRWLNPGTNRIIDTKAVRISQIDVFDVRVGEGVGPGDWMYHCHVVEHMQFGMIGTFRVY